MKVIHCAETIKGGIATYLNQLIPLQRKAYGPNSIWIVVPDDQLDEIDSVSNVSIITYKAVKSRAVNAFLLAYVVLKLTFQHKINLIHIHSTFAGISIRILNAILYKRFIIIYCPHGWAWDMKAGQFFKNFIKLVENILSKVTDAIVCISEHEKISAENNSISCSRLHIIKNGLCLERPQSLSLNLNLPIKERKVLFVGRFDRQKGADVFVSAIKELGDSFHGIMAGGNVVSKNEELGLPSNITNVGWVNKSELEYLFNVSDVVVIPSRWEGFGLIALEAMRAGLPIVATRVGGLKEVVLDNETGVLIEPDSVAELKYYLKNLSNKDLKRMGEAGKIRLRELFAIERVFSETANLYMFLLNKK